MSGKKKEIVFTKPLSLWIGDKIYKLSLDNAVYREFSGRCPSCGGTGYVTYTGYDKNDYEVNCPLCRGRQNRDQLLRLYKIDVEMYIVHSVTINAPRKMSAYRDGTIPEIDYVSMKAFRKTGRRNEDFVECVVPVNECLKDRLDPPLEKTKVVKDRWLRDFVFSSKEKAEAFRDVLVEDDKRELEIFNANNGTDYKYPF